MMNDKDFVLSVMKKYGKQIAEELQSKSEEMTGEELYDEFGFIPNYLDACKKQNMLERKIGFVCRSPKGRVVKLIQNYDSTIYTQEPEELLAQWRFVWSKNPKHARAFIALSTSPYDMGYCCIGYLLQESIGYYCMNSSFYFLYL